jgi:prophage regulatory protein
MKIHIDLKEIDQKLDAILVVQNHTLDVIGDLARNFPPKERLQTPDPVLLRLKEVTRLTALSRSTIYNYISENRFPEAVLVGDRSVRWLRSEVEAWIQIKIEQGRGAQQR